MTSEYWIIGIQDDLIITWFCNHKCIIRNGIHDMEIEYKNQVVFLKDNGLVQVIH